jgi:hypothetical protein
MYVVISGECERIRNQNAECRAPEQEQKPVEVRSARRQLQSTNWRLLRLLRDAANRTLEASPS